MPLNYQEKLQLLDTKFCKYSFELLEQYVQISDNRPLPPSYTSFQRILLIFENIPLLGSLPKFIFTLFQFVKTPNRQEADRIVMLFQDLTEEEKRRIFSDIILEVAVYFEKLIEKEDKHGVTTLAIKASSKMFNALQNTHYSKDFQIDRNSILKALLEPRSWLEYFRREPQSQEPSIASNNYRTITRAEVQHYLTNENIDYLHNLRLKDNTQLILSKEARFLANDHKVDFTYRDLNPPVIPKHNSIFPMPTLDLHFVGRKDKVNKMHESINTVTPLVVSGLYGVGKTQTVAKFFNAFREEYSKTIFFHAEDTDRLEREIISFATEDLGINIDKKQKHFTLTQVLENIAYKVANLEKILFVFDHAETSEDLNNFIDIIRNTKKHHIIITTQNNIPWRVKNYIKIIDIEELSEIHAIEYIRRNLNNPPPPGENDDVKMLANLFGRIPLALSQSTGHINSKDLTIPIYIEEYNKRKHGIYELSEWLDTSVYSNRKSLYSLLILTLKELSPQAKKILNLCIYLDQYSIPKYLFENSVARSPAEYRQALASLKSYSLITDQNSNFNIYRIVQEIVKHAIDPNDLEYLREATRVVNGEMIDTSKEWDEHKITRQNKPMLEHAISLIRHYQNIETSLTDKLATAKLHTNCGNSYLAMGQLNKALEHYNAAENILPVNTVNSNSKQAINLVLIEIHKGRGKIYELSLQHEQSFNEYTKALDLKDPSYREDDIEILRIKYELANINCKGKHYQKAIEEYETLLLKISGMKEVDIILDSRFSETKVKKLIKEITATNTDIDAKLSLSYKILNAMGNVYKLQKQNSKALYLYEYSIYIAKNRYQGQEDSHPYILIHKLQIIQVKLSLKQFKDLTLRAEDILNHYKSMHNQQDHIDIARTHHLLGIIYTHQEKYKYALEHHEESLRITNTYKEYCNEKAIALQGTAQAYRQATQYHKAIKNFEDAFDTKKKLHNNENHQDCLDIRKQLNMVELTNLLLVPFIVKELLESAPTLKYLFKEIIPIYSFYNSTSIRTELPDFLYTNSFWISIHLGSSMTAVYMIDTKYITEGKWMAAATYSGLYGIKLFSYNYFSSYSAEEDHKLIHNIGDFFYECTDDIVYQVSIGGLNLLLSTSILHVISSHLKYDLARLAIIEGMQCYNKHKPLNEIDSNPTDKIGSCYTSISFYAPYIADLLSVVLLSRSMEFTFPTKLSNNNALATNLIVIKQILITINMVVMTDLTTKIILEAGDNYVQDLCYNIDKEIDYTGKLITNILEDIYHAND
jgi:tetratricopeptide (TPR) repeat protein